MRVRIKENRRVNMRARIPILSEKDKKKIVAEAERELEKKWKQREDELSVELTRRIIKVFIYVMNERYSFGKKRLLQLIGDFTEKLEQTKTDEVFWEHIDKVVIDYLKIPLERDYTEKGRPI